MKLSWTLPIALAALVVAPTTASAAFDPPPPATYCMTADAAQCVSFAAGEATLWKTGLGGRQTTTSDSPASGTQPAIPAGSVLISWTRDKYAFAGVPEGTSVLRQASVQVVMLYAADGAARQPLTVNMTRASHDTTAVVCQFYRYDEGNGASRKVARDDTPADVFAGCGFERRHSDPAPPDPTGTTQDEVESTRPAAKVAKCAPVKVAAKKIAVTALGVGCYPARNILVRYMKTGKKPAGYVCTKLAVGKARTASCRTPGKAAKKITGRWRV